MKLLPHKLILAPTDLSNFLSCKHLAALDLASARGERERPVRYDPLIQELRARGHRHERAYLERLRDQGWTIAGDNNTGDDDQPTIASLEETLAAMRAGTDVVYQATLEDEAWSGRAPTSCAGSKHQATLETGPTRCLTPSSPERRRRRLYSSSACTPNCSASSKVLSLNGCML